MNLVNRGLNPENIARAAKLLRPAIQYRDTVIAPGFVESVPVRHFSADTFPTIHPIDWLHSHFAVGGYSPLHRLGGMQTAHMTTIAARNGFTWHPHRSLEIYTWVLEGTIHHEDTTGGEGDIGPGELQRMFSGSLIYHQELNLTDKPVRVIQIWYAPEPQYEELEPHYQQLRSDQLPSRRVGEATILSLIGGGSPMEQHMRGRLTATVTDPGGITHLEAPSGGEELFLYVTDGAGEVSYPGYSAPIGQYDVILARPDAPEVILAAHPGSTLNFLSFYLPPFISG